MAGALPSAPLAAANSRTSPAAAARAASALAAAKTTHATAQTAYDTARLELAATSADHEAAMRRVEEVGTLAEAAMRRVEVSRRTWAALVRAMVRHGSDTAVLDAVLGSQGGTDLLARLGVVDRLATLTANMSQIREQVELDEQRSRSLQAAYAGAQDAADSFPLADRQAKLAAAGTQLDRATAALAAVAQTAQTALAGSAPAASDRPAQAPSEPAGLLDARLSGQGWASPAVGPVSDVFGPRPDLPLPGVLPFHSGTDLAAACGAPVYAASAGVVMQTGPLGTYGNWILIDHGNGVSTGYAHLRDGTTLVSPGDAVSAGQVLAGVGSTGASTGCHLHIEVRVGGTAVDAQPFFAAHGIDLGAG